MRAGSVVKMVVWTGLVACAVYVLVDSDLRRFVGLAAVFGACLYVGGLVVRRRRLGRASPSELDVMTGAAFEDYVAERFRAAGWSTSPILRRGDFGADLTAERGGIRIAVQAKRRGRNVGNRAVQEAAAGADFHRCDAAVVVTQARFTEAARRQADAARTPVALIGRDDLARLPAALETLSKRAAKTRKS